MSMCETHDLAQLIHISSLLLILPYLLEFGFVTVLDERHIIYYNCIHPNVFHNHLY